MTLYADVIADVTAAEEGPHVGAFFDFDGTIIHGFSALVFIREQLRAGYINIEEFLKLTSWMVSFGFGSMDFSTMLSLSSQFMADMPEEEMESFAKKVYEKYIAKSIYPESRALIEAHLKKGHTVAIISSATQYQIKHAADDLDVPHRFTSMLEIKDGNLTGKTSSSCFGVGKVQAAKSLIEQENLDTSKSFFYSDGEEDLPLLELVGNPSPLNPDKKLSEIAEANQWPIRRFKSRGRPSLQVMARSIGAYASFLASFAAGAPIWALTRSTKRARNFSISLFADSASAVIGLDIKVKNERYLWSNRPAVFIYNHQSKTDVLIMASLLRKDVVGVGKQEIKNIPVIGQVMQQAGMILIDRKNSSSSIEAMKPLVDAIHNEQLSPCIAPEGTRSVSKKLAPFKKGAFHIAMQAKVPIVPIVIHNALDSAPKGQFAFTPCTVEIEVLEPVDTKDWNLDNLDENIDAIWKKYESTLATTSQQSPKKKTKKARSKPAKKTRAKIAKASVQRKKVLSKSQLPDIQSLVADTNPTTDD